MVRFDFGPLLQGQMRVAKVKSAYNLLIIAPRGLVCDTIRSDLALGRLQRQMTIAKVKSVYSSLLILEVCSVLWIQICTSSPMR